MKFWNAKKWANFIIFYLNTPFRLPTLSLLGKDY